MAREVVRKHIELNGDDVAWFEQQYPKGSLSATLGMLFTKFREVNEHTPAEYAEIAARALSEELGS